MRLHTAAAAGARWMQSLLFEVSPYDPATFVTVPFGLLAVIVLASIVPARRPSRVDLVTAIRGFD